MSGDLSKKLKNFFGLLLTIILDSLLVMAVAGTTFVVKWIIEKCYGKALEKIDNIALQYVYLISKYVLIISVCIYTFYDIYVEVKKIFKEIESDLD